MTDQDHWINRLKSGCNFCHQLGNALTRDVKHVFAAKPDLAKTHQDAWEWRLGVGVRGTNMYGTLTGMGKTETVKALADWTEAIEKGAVPPAPPRPSGIERNIVSTQWDVGDDHSFMHDQISTDKYHPTVNGGGPNYAVNAGHGQLVILDQADNSTYSIDIPTRETKDKVPSRFPAPNRPSFFWGNEHLWSNPPYDPADPHNPMIDSKGRVWLTSKIRGNTAPAWCSDPSNKYAEWYPMRNSARQASIYDPKTKQFQLIETCYSTHHVVIDNDPDETVYFNELSGPIFGWIDSKIYDQTLAATNDESKAEQAAVGWCEQTVDTNGDGKITRPWNDIRADRGSRGSVRNGHGGSGSCGSGWRTEEAREAAAPQAPFDPKLDTHGPFQPVLDHAEPGGRLRVGRRGRFPRLFDPSAARKQSAGELQDPSLQGAGAGLRSSRNRRRQQRRGLDRSGGDQPPGQLRRSQVQELDRQDEGRRQRLPGRLDAVPNPRPEAEGHECSRRLPLFQLDGFAEYHAAREEHSVPDGFGLRLADCA